MINIPIVKSFSRLEDWIFKWWLVIPFTFGWLYTISSFYEKGIDTAED